MKADGTRRSRRAPVRSAFFLAVLSIGPSIGLFSCSSQSPPESVSRTLDRARSADLDGPWDHLQAALQTALKEHEAAILSQWTPEPGVRVYEILTITDRRYVLRAETTKPNQPFEASDLRLAIAAELWEDPAFESEFIQTVRARLGELRSSAPAY